MPDSPLSRVVRNRRVNAILEAIRLAVQSGRPISISPKDVYYIRRRFSRGLALGESQLHQFARDLQEHFFPGQKFQKSFVVIGRCYEGERTETVERQVDLSEHTDELFSTPNMSLADRYVPICPGSGRKATVIASYVKYDPVGERDPRLVHFFTRTKTTSNICYKIADMVFDIDDMFRRDKIYNAFSQVMSDIYGLKFVLSKPEMIPEFTSAIWELRGLDVVEIKDYTGSKRKESGFEAYKMVLRKDLQLFEVQLQSNDMFENEKSSIPASHRTYKERQMGDRRKLGREYLELFQALSQLFAKPKSNYCDIEYIELGYGSKGLDDEF